MATIPELDWEAAARSLGALDGSIEERAAVARGALEAAYQAGVAEGRRLEQEERQASAERAAGRLEGMARAPQAMPKGGA